MHTLKWFHNFLCQFFFALHKLTSNALNAHTEKRFSFSIRIKCWFWCCLFQCVCVFIVYVYVFVILLGQQTARVAICRAHTKTKQKLQAHESNWNDANVPATERPFFIFAATLSRRDARLRSELGRAELALSLCCCCFCSDSARSFWHARSLTLTHQYGRPVRSCWERTTCCWTWVSVFICMSNREREKEAERVSLTYLGARYEIAMSAGRYAKRSLAVSVPKSRERVRERENCNGNISHKHGHNTHTVPGKQEANTIRALEFAVREPNPHYARKREKTWQSFWSLVMLLLPLLLPLFVSPHFHFQKWKRKLYDADIAANCMKILA